MESGERSSGLRSGGSKKQAGSGTSTMSKNSRSNPKKSSKMAFCAREIIFDIIKHTWAFA
jgi:hypothetical protein